MLIAYDTLPFIYSYHHSSMRFSKLNDKSPATMQTPSLKNITIPKGKSLSIGYYIHPCEPVMQAQTMVTVFPNGAQKAFFVPAVHKPFRAFRNWQRDKY